MALSTLILVCLVFVLAGFTKGIIGLGLPTIAMGLLAVVLPPAEAAALLILPSLVTNVWQMLDGPHLGPLLRRLWPLNVGVCLGTWLGAALLAGIGGRHGGLALGVALLAYAASGLAALRLVVPRAAEPVLGPITGALTGGITAATGVFVIPAVPYLQAIGLQKDELVQALGLSFTVSTLALAVALAGVDAFAPASSCRRCWPSSFPWPACGLAKRCVTGCGRRPSGCASSSGFWRSAPISHCVVSAERPMDGRQGRRYGPEPPVHPERFHDRARPQEVERRQPSLEGLPRGVAGARRSRRLLPADRPLWHVRPDRQPHLDARAGRARRLPDQRLRPALRGDHRLEPDQDRPRGQRPRPARLRRSQVWRQPRRLRDP